MMNLLEKVVDIVLTLAFIRDGAVLGRCNLMPISCLHLYLYGVDAAVDV